MAARPTGAPMERVKQMVQRVLSRPPTKDEQQILAREYQIAKQYYESHPTDSQALTTVGQLPQPMSVDVNDLAGEMVLASMILNLGESITHE